MSLCKRYPPINFNVWLISNTLVTLAFAPAVIPTATSVTVEVVVGVVWLISNTLVTLAFAPAVIPTATRVTVEIVVGVVWLISNTFVTLVFAIRTVAITCVTVDIGRLLTNTLPTLVIAPVIIPTATSVTVYVAYPLGVYIGRSLSASFSN